MAVWLDSFNVASSPAIYMHMMPLTSSHNSIFDLERPGFGPQDGACGHTSRRLS